MTIKVSDSALEKDREEERLAIVRRSMYVALLLAATRCVQQQPNVKSKTQLDWHSTFQVSVKDVPFRLLGI